MKLLLLLTFISFSFSTIETFNPLEKKEQTAISDDIKEQAFHILQTKCNVCHSKKNKKAVFSLDNMDEYSGKIYKQVFKWKRMPKGNEIQLTPEEYKQLKTWISSSQQK